MHTYVQVHMCGSVCGGQGLAWSAFLNHFFRQFLSLDLELTDPAKLAVQQALVGTSCLLPPSPGLQALPP